jgi:Holliday junction resolvase RusA-like endonuclease
VTFVILGAPRTKKNSSRIVRSGGVPRIIPSRAHDEWERFAILQLQQQMSRHRGTTFYETPLNMRAIIYREKAVGDLLNFLAAVSDALERAGVVSNDRWIAAVDGSRMDVDKVRPRVEIDLMPLTGGGRMSMGRPCIDALFLAEYRDHAATSLTCGCNPGDEPDRDCDLGFALYQVAYQQPWSQRKAAEAEGR